MAEFETADIAFFTKSKDYAGLRYWIAREIEYGNHKLRGQKDKGMIYKIDYYVKFLRKLDYLLATGEMPNDINGKLLKTMAPLLYELASDPLAPQCLKATLDSFPELKP